MGSKGQTQANSLDESRVLSWCELLSVLWPTPDGRTFLSTASSPGRTRDGAWSPKPRGTGCPAVHPNEMMDSGQNGGEKEGCTLV